MEHLDMKKQLAQGIMAGINAAARVLGKEEQVLSTIRCIYWCFN